MIHQPIKTHMPSVAQLLISLAGLVSTLSSVAGLAVIVLAGATAQTMQFQSTAPMGVLIWANLLIALVTIPSLILSIRRLARVPVRQMGIRKGLLFSSILLLAMVPLVYLVYQDPSVLEHSFLSALLTVLVVAVPLWWFVEIGRRRLSTGSLQRQWGLVNFSIYAGLPVVIFVEILLILLVLILAGVWVAGQDDFKPILMTLQTQMMLNPQDFSILTERFGTLFQKPEVLVAGFGLAVILVPLIEELLKPLALWFFIKRDWSPSEGFTAGLLCGAAFALVESVFSIASVQGDAWLATLAGRVGTGLLHTLTAGITGWALVSTWRDGKFKRVGLAYLVSIAIHGLWNFFALLFGLSSTLALDVDPSMSTLIDASPWVLAALAVGMLLMLFFMNRKIAKSIPPAVIPPLPPETMG